MQVAVRKPSKETSVRGVMKRKGKKEIDICQALEFRRGVNLPAKCRKGLSEKETSKECFTLLPATFGGRILIYARTATYSRKTRRRVGNRVHSIKRRCVSARNWLRLGLGKAICG
jgi:hypothetical protein